MVDDLNSSLFRGFVRPTAWLAGGIFAVALMLLPFAWSHPGSAGPLGLAIAATICLAASIIGEALAYALHGKVSPLGGMLLGMAARMCPPLAVCLFLAAQRAEGGQYLGFICYLLAFYLTTLALETWITVHRASRNLAYPDRPAQ